MTYNFFDKAAHYSIPEKSEYGELLTKIENADKALQNAKNDILFYEKKNEGMNEFARKQELLCKALQDKIKDSSAPEVICTELKGRTQGLEEYKKVIERNQKVLNDLHTKYEALKNTQDREKQNFIIKFGDHYFGPLSQIGA